MKTITIREDALEMLVKRYNRRERAVDRYLDRGDVEKAREAQGKQVEMFATLRDLGFIFDFSGDDRDPLVSISHKSDTPEDIWSAMEKAEKALEDAAVASAVNVDEDRDLIEVWIAWGDWKHDHARADYILAGLGFEKAAETVIEEDGSDCYSSSHYYRWR
jgi:hypothetical protein